MKPARRLRQTLPLMAVCACLPATAHAAISARLSAAFDPDRLGARTTLDFGFSFSAPPGRLPAPLTQIDLRYPQNLGIGLSGLGLATCSAKTLEAAGVGGCPHNSIMGRGVVLTGIVLGASVIDEQAPITILRAPNHNGDIGLLFYAEGTKPVTTNIVFAGLLVPAPAPFGGQVNIGVPLVPTLPGAPYISVIRLRATLGPKDVTYYEQVSGQTLAFHPRGILLPKRCPRAGFPFAAEFSFLDETHVRARTAAPCPGGGRGATGRRHRHPRHTAGRVGRHVGSR